MKPLVFILLLVSFSVEAISFGDLSGLESNAHHLLQTVRTRREETPKKPLPEKPMPGCWGHLVAYGFSPRYRRAMADYVNAKPLRDRLGDYLFRENALEIYLSLLEEAEALVLELEALEFSQDLDEKMKRGIAQLSQDFFPLVSFSGDTLLKPEEVKRVKDRLEELEGLLTAVSRDLVSRLEEGDIEKWFSATRDEAVASDVTQAQQQGQVASLREKLKHTERQLEGARTRLESDRNDGLMYGVLGLGLGMMLGSSMDDGD